jgi:Xaa-Pro aminopeptidase
MPNIFDERIAQLQGKMAEDKIDVVLLTDPELKQGVKTSLEEGMTLCLDGGITIPGEFGARVGDSFVVTKTGHEILTGSLPCKPRLLRRG